MPLSEKILGFDARTLDLTDAQAWDQARRDTFLLRTDVRTPYSVDVVVWPSVRTGLTRPGQLTTASSSMTSLLRTPGDVGAHLSNELSLGSFAVVAMTVLDSTQPASQEMEFLHYLASTAAQPSLCDFSLLGYDIADYSLISGLTNCGYPPESLSGLREEWAPLLNSYHLFTDNTEADRFRHLADSHVASHAPFFVYGLYRVA